jgi:hypothetical protein
MTWFPWGRKKKKLDFNAFLVSQAKQKKHQEESQQFQKELGLQTSCRGSSSNANKGPAENSTATTGPSSFAASIRRASARAQSIAKTNFSQYPKSFSLVLTNEDMKGLELQQKLETLRREGQKLEESYREEMGQLKQELGRCKRDLADRWREGIEWSEYLEIAQQEIAAVEAEQKWAGYREEEDDEGNEDARGTTGSIAQVYGQLEVDLMKAMHKAELQDRTRKRLQKFTNDEILRLYKLESTIKEDFAEREAKILSKIAKLDAHLKIIRDCHERRLDISERMNKRHEEAAQLHFDRIYKALKEESSDDESDTIGEITMSSSNQDCVDSENKGELEVQRRPSMKQSYSSRILAVNAKEKEVVQRMKEEVSKRMSRTVVVEENDETMGADEEEENNDPSRNGNKGEKEKENVTASVGEKAIPQNDSSTRGKEASSVPSYTGASRNTRVSGAVVASRGAKSTSLPMRRRSSDSSSALRASALAAARARAAGRVSVAGRGSPRVTSAKTTLGAAAATRFTAAEGARSNIAPRRVTAGAARK